jgi:L-arabinose isomerase
MRQVAVTEGDKVEAEIKFGYSVNGYGMGDLVKLIKEVGDGEIGTLASEYEAKYTVVAEPEERRHSSSIVA